jgi:hypothetical protein
MTFKTHLFGLKGSQFIVMYVEICIVDSVLRLYDEVKQIRVYKHWFFPLICKSINCHPAKHRYSIVPLLKILDQGFTRKTI